MMPCCWPNFVPATMDKRILTHYTLWRLTNEAIALPATARHKLIGDFLQAAGRGAQSTWWYQLSPTTVEADLLQWNSLELEDDNAPDRYFGQQAQALLHFRPWIAPVRTLWGMTKPSVYSKASRSAQEIDPFSATRLPYFIIYPFTKTTEWYLKSREERQEMMNGHIKIGKQHKEITQLLLYSFGLQDQEFVVSYECEKLHQFSDLVYELRGTEARLYTLNDQPIITGIFRTPQQLCEILC